MCRKQFDYRVWWRWNEGGVEYVIAPDITAATPVDHEYEAAGCYRTVLEALDFIGQSYRDRIPYTIAIHPITAVDLSLASDARRGAEYGLTGEEFAEVREHEADSITRLAQLDEWARDKAREARRIAEMKRIAESA
jgi:hypothetical protein